ncbi:MAG: SagB family peptide dehydrogenase [Labedaea sp.]
MSEQCTRRLRLRPEVSLATDAGGRVALVHGARWGEQLGALSVADRELLHGLAAGEHPEPELLARFGAAGRTLLHRLRAGGWLTIHFGHGARALLTVRPLGPNREPRLAGPPVVPRLSRFALLHRDSDTLLLEAPLCRAAVVVHDAEIMALLHHLAVRGGSGAPVRLPAGVVAELVTELAWYGFVREAEEDVRPDLSDEQWSQHELWFHARSRSGFHDQPFGGTLWAATKYPPLPARREPWSGTAVALPEPAPDPTPPSFNAVLDSRRSVRAWDDAHPLTVAQLGEFLYRAGRVRRVAVDGRHEVSRRPSPSGGALHSLEIYPVANNVAGLATGMYHYDPFAHVLEPVPVGEPAVRQLVDHARTAAGGTLPPHVLLVLSARFGRVMWKYQSMAYALILKDLGALMQTMYLVATAMNLAPCALGSGDADLFAQATNLDQRTEASVGEFLLSAPAG